MSYLPIRVYSVFSRGKGTVDPVELASYLDRQNIPFLPVTDPFAIMGWESFRKEAVKRGMRPLPGMEIRIRGTGSMLLFPAGEKGYLSLVHSFNCKHLTKMEDMVVVFIVSRRGSFRLGDLEKLQMQVPTGNLYVGLEWDTKRDVIDLARKAGLPLVWAQSLRYIYNPIKYAVSSSIFNHQPLPEMINRVENGREFRISGPIAAGAIIKRWGETGRIAMRNTFEVARRASFDFSKLPGVSISGNSRQELESAKQLETVINSCLARNNPSLAGRDRTLRELKIIQTMGFSSFFIIASEIASYCKTQGIYFNLRGSGVSSYVLFLLGLSRINPLRFNLLFERFVNSRRVDLPDIDIDIESHRRAEVLTWVFEKYRNRVAFVSTHKFFRARSALYEVARSSGYNPDDAHKLSKELPMFSSPQELEGRGKGSLKELYSNAALLEGVYKELSLHVGGVVFSFQESHKLFPLVKSPQGFPQTLWDKDTIDRLRIFKLDLLGIRGFDVISPAAIDWRAPFDDNQVWENIRQAKTVGCFQLESPLARENLTKVRPEKMEDLAVAIAIIRPGPAKSGMKQAYIEKRAPFHPLLLDIFPHTRGALIFEEQISVLLHTVARWGLDQSEVVRRSLKKKKGSEYREDFFKRGRVNRWTDEELQQFWKIAVDFSLYAFNHAHSLSYSYSAYISAWMKTRHPVTFFCRLFNSGGGYYSLLFYLEEAQKSGIKILPPDLNLSNVGFSQENGAIRMGFISIKGIGTKFSSRILEKRGTGYSSIEDFIAKTRVGEKELAKLLAVSAFESLGTQGFTIEEKKKNWREFLGFIPG